jgi:hypothetical protein
MDAQGSDRRRRSRVPVKLTVTVRCEGEEVVVKSRNLSFKGLACEPDGRLPKNACCEVILRLAPDIEAVIRGRVVRTTNRETAIDFTAMDPESFSHLRKIVEYHAPQPEILLRELAQPAFPLSRPRILEFPRKRRS